MNGRWVVMFFLLVGVYFWYWRQGDSFLSSQLQLHTSQAAGQESIVGDDKAKESSQAALLPGQESIVGDDKAKESSQESIVSDEWQEELLTPEEIIAIKAKWSHLTERTTNVLDEMLATRNEKIKRFSNQTKVALLALHDVDHRLGPVLLSFRKVLPPDWKIQIYYSPDNAEWLEPEVKQVQAVLNMIMPRNLSYSAYSDFIRTKLFWETALGDNILTFQTDTMLCGNSPFKIYDFMIYDYIGAPWGHALSNCGNGGLSFRHREAMLFILRNGPPGGQQEDSSFCFALGHAAYTGIYHPVMAHYNISRCFSVETWTSEVPLGVHAPGKYFGNSGEALFTYCPEARLATANMKAKPPSR